MDPRHSSQADATDAVNGSYIPSISDVECRGCGPRIRRISKGPQVLDFTGDGAPRSVRQHTGTEDRHAPKEILPDTGLAAILRRWRNLQPPGFRRRWISTVLRGVRSISRWCSG